MRNYQILKREFESKVRRFNKIVIWGLRHRRHTHRYIHHHFYTTLCKLGASVVWVEDKRKNEDVIEKEDLVIAVDIAGYNLPIKKNVYYCLHNMTELRESIEPHRYLGLQVYKNIAEEADERWDETTLFDTKTVTLYQPWGTNLLPYEFKKPVKRNYRRRAVFWIGSIWNDQWNQGNIDEIGELKRELKKRNLRFIHLQHIPDFLNVYFVRRSRFAPAIAGRWQVENSYLPCRMFKNISYGQLGISNVRKFQDLFKGCSVPGNTIGELVDNVLAISPKDYRELTYEQQEIVKNHTYLQKLLNIFTAFERISEL